MAILNHQGLDPTTTVNFDTTVTNQGNAFWVPEIYSKNVLMTYRTASVAEGICNTDYFGEITQFGDTVNIIKEPSITTYEYHRGGALGGGGTGDWARTALTDEEDTLTIDQARVFEFLIEDLETRFSHVNWNSLAADRAAYELQKVVDQNVLAAILANVATSPVDHIYGADGSGANVTTLANAIAATTPVSIGQTSAVDPLDLLARFARLMDDRDVPEENRWVVAGPSFYESLAKTASKLMSVDYNQGQGGLRNGLVAEGKLRGFSLYKSNNLPSTTYADGVLLAGHMGAVAYASDMTKVESYRSQTVFGDAVRGMMVWGRKVLRPTSLCACYYDVV